MSRRSEKNTPASPEPTTGELLPPSSAAEPATEEIPATAVDETPSRQPEPPETDGVSESLGAATSEAAAGSPVPVPAPHAGTLLRQARETAGLSIDEVSHTLKLKPKQVVALEALDFETLPARAFVRGFIRNYARLLKIDADAVLAALPPETPKTLSLAASSLKTPASEMAVIPAAEEKPPTHSFSWKWLLAILLLIVCAAALLFMPQIEAYLAGLTPPEKVNATETAITPDFDADAAHSASTLPAAPPAVTPLAETPAAPVVPAPTPGVEETPAALPPEITKIPEENVPQADAPSETPPPAAEASALTLRFSGECWVEVREASGKALYAELAKAGTEKTVDGKPPFLLVLGNSKAAEITFRGQPVDLSSFKQSVARLTLE